MKTLPLITVTITDADCSNLSSPVFELAFRRLREQLTASLEHDGGRYARIRLTLEGRLLEGPLG